MTQVAHPLAALFVENMVAVHPAEFDFTSFGYRKPLCGSSVGFLLGHIEPSFQTCYLLLLGIDNHDHVAPLDFGHAFDHITALFQVC